jgi:hypothetical protein
MPRIAYEEKRFNSSSLRVIHTANEIIAEYREQDLILTLRQLYYQFVARGLAENSQKSYKRIGSIINDARMAGALDWNAIEDRTRNLQALSHWDSAAHIVDACASQFRVDRWANQKHRPEVWIEKDALTGVIANVCAEYDVPYFACRGYVSQSEQWRAGRRFGGYVAAGQEPVVFHLGDHDPSGVDMSRDNEARLRTFAEHFIDLRRLALNMDQVEEHNPPPNPAKLTDARAQGYIARFGRESWELDALEPSLLVSLVRDAIKSLIDRDAWTDSDEEQTIERDRLEDAASRLREDQD